MDDDDTSAGTPQPALEPPALDSLRRQIDEIDDGLQDLLVRRATLVEQIGGLKRDGNVGPLRPGREARILRRLVGRHRGSFPRASLVRVWREILSATVLMQAELAVAVCAGCWDLARDHFGSQTPLLLFASADEVTSAVAEGRVALGVLPLAEDDDPEPWWLALASREERRPRVIARLPFGALGNAADTCSDGFVIAAVEADASGDDCTLLAIAAAHAIDTAAITNAFLVADIDANPIARAERAGADAHLVEIDSLLAAGDERLEAALAPLGLGRRVTWLGFYARPLPDAAMGGIAPV